MILATRATATSNKQQATATSNSNSNSNKQQVGLNYTIAGTPIAQGPKLRPKGPLPKALLPTKFGPPTPGWRRSAATLPLKMASNRQQVATSRWASFNISGTPIA